MRTAITLILAIALMGCGTTKLAVDPGGFPVPLMNKAPVKLGVWLDEDLTTYVHREAIENKGEWEVSIGPAQTPLFANLATGVFEDYRLTAGLDDADGLDGTLHPEINEVQFSLPSQTRSNYYEVWIKYRFQLYDRAGTLVSEWTLPAYGKASKKNYGGSSGGLQAAALAACRDAMAFFSINFAREPAIRTWLAAGKPLVPPPAPQSAPTPGNTPGGSGGATPGTVPAGAGGAPSGGTQAASKENPA